MPDPQATRTIHADRTTDPVHGQQPATYRTLEPDWQYCLDRLKRSGYSELRPWDVAEWSRDQVDAAIRHVAILDADSRLRAAGDMPQAWSSPPAPAFLRDAHDAAKARDSRDSDERTAKEDEELAIAGSAIVAASRAKRAANRDWRAACVRLEKALAPAEHREGFGLPMVIDGHVVAQWPSGFDVTEIKTKVDREG